jgi:hypothetical protein
VFKIFVANPQKAPPIIDILCRNKEKLIEFLQKFQAEKGGIVNDTCMPTSSAQTTTSSMRRSGFC